MGPDTGHTGQTCPEDTPGEQHRSVCGDEGARATKSCVFPVTCFLTALILQRKTSHISRLVTRTVTHTVMYAQKPKWLQTGSLGEIYTDIFIVFASSKCLTCSDKLISGLTAGPALQFEKSHSHRGFCFLLYVLYLKFNNDDGFMCYVVFT